MKARADVGICLGYLVVAAAFFKVAVLDAGTDRHDPAVADLVSYYYPMMRYGFARLREGDLPLWDTYQSCGTPLLASAHFGFLYPLYAPFLLISPEMAINVDIVVHLTIGSVGMYLLCRHLGMQRSPSFIAGIVYAYHGSMMVKISFADLLAAVSWIPFVFLLVDRVIRVPSWRRCALLAIVIGLSLLGGHLQAIYFEVLALVPFVVCRSAWGVRTGGAATVIRAPALLAVAGGLGITLALVRLLPSQEFVSHGWRFPGSLGIEAASVMAVSPESYVRNLISPEPGRGLAREVYVGILPLALALVGVLRWRPRSASMPIAAAGIGAVVYAFGPRTILYRAIFHLPAGNWFRGPDRALIVFGFAIAVLCGAGIDAVLSDGIGAVGPDHRRRLTMLVVPAAAVALIAVLNLSLAQHAAAALATVYGVAGIAMLCVIAVSDARPVGRTAAIVALGALVLFDLGHAQPHEGVLPSRLGPYFTRLEPIFAEIRRRQGFARTYIWATFERADPLYFLSDIAKAGLNHGIWMATDYEPLGGRRLETYMDAFGPTTPIIGPFGYRPFSLSDENLPLVELMGIRFFLVTTGREAPFVARAPRLTARWNLILADQGVSLYEDPGAMARCFIVSRIEVEHDEASLLARLKREDLRNVALVEEMPDADLVRTTPDGSHDARAEVIRYTPDRVVIDADSRDGGFLVLTDQYYPGWRASVDGKPAPIYRTDYLFRGLRLPPGRHRVAFAYRPRNFCYGAIGTLAGILGIALLLGLTRDQAHAA